jgi:hypothetical protein
VGAWCSTLADNAGTDLRTRLYNPRRGLKWLDHRTLGALLFLLLLLADPEEPGREDHRKHAGKRGRA